MGKKQTQIDKKKNSNTLSHCSQWLKNMLYHIVRQFPKRISMTLLCSISMSFVMLSIPSDSGYPHDGHADAAYRHGRHADKRRYPHYREIEIQM